MYVPPDRERRAAAEYYFNMYAGRRSRLPRRNVGSCLYLIGFTLDARGADNVINSCHCRDNRARIDHKLGRRVLAGAGGDGCCKHKTSVSMVSCPSRVHLRTKFLIVLSVFKNEKRARACKFYLFYRLVQTVVDLARRTTRIRARSKNNDGARISRSFPKRRQESSVRNKFTGVSSSL